MSKRHHRHSQYATQNRAVVLVNDGHWTVTGLPQAGDTAIDITIVYTGSGSGTLQLYTVARNAPGGAASVTLSTPFSGAGTYTISGTISGWLYASALTDTLGTLSYGLI